MSPRVPGRRKKCGRTPAICPFSALEQEPVYLSRTVYEGELLLEHSVLPPKPAISQANSDLAHELCS